jgi:hypothetical protein
MRRHEELVNPSELDDLKLASKYDEIIDDRDLTEEYLIMHGYLQELRGKRIALPKNKKHRYAVELYESLQEYDALLEQLKGRYPTISFHELTTDENIVPDIVRLFGSDQKLRNLYKKIDKFKGLREADVVSIYTGIWYTDDLRYVIGDANPMNSSQARAHRIRQFIVHQGKEQFDITEHLEAMSVTFVRLNQYTVYPYYYNLIGLYIDIILKHQHKAINLSNLGL